MAYVRVRKLTCLWGSDYVILAVELSRVVAYISDEHNVLISLLIRPP